MFKILVLLSLGISTLAQAEYRVYQLIITNSNTNDSRVVVSTLDHIQYASYFYLHNYESVKIEDSWRCLRRSEYLKPTCPNPKTSPQQKPNSTTPQPAPPNL